MNKPVIPRCKHQACDLVTLTVVCHKFGNIECQYAGMTTKNEKPCFEPRGD